MAYIYQIINDINDKIYVGKTEFSIEKRFKEHCNDAFSERCEKRPLYSAMRKYGIEHFHIELIEETDKPEEREVYWIEQKRSFKNGYNATVGGDGKKYLDYDLIIATYKELQSIVEVANKIGCSTDAVTEILRGNNIKIFSSSEVCQKKYGKIVNRYNLQGEYIDSFPSCREAAKFLGKKVEGNGHGACSHISDVAKGKRKTAYGYIWKFSE